MRGVHDRGQHGTRHQKGQYSAILRIECDNIIEIDCIKPRQMRAYTLICDSKSFLFDPTIAMSSVRRFEIGESEDVLFT